MDEKRILQEILEYLNSGECSLRSTTDNAEDIVTSLIDYERLLSDAEHDAEDFEAQSGDLENQISDLGNRVWELENEVEELRFNNNDF